MREILRQRLAAHPISPRVTSVIVTFHWGDGEERQRPLPGPHRHQDAWMR